MDTPKQDLRDLTHEEMQVLVRELGAEPYRAAQIHRWVHERAVDSIEGMTDLSQGLRTQLGARAYVGGVELDLEQVSADGTRKLRLRTHDRRMIEAVLIPDGGSGEDDDDEEETSGPYPSFPRRPKLTLCLSSQVGCALDCTFCATAQLGFGGQLSAGEIVDQVYRAKHITASLPADDATRLAGADHLTNLVFMGMGEPLHNYGNVLKAIRILTSPLGANFSRRRITVSTAGLVPGIEKLAREPPGLRVNLAVSLNATTDEVRNRIMPINRKWNLGRLLEAVKKVPLDRRRRVTFEYVLLGGVNDTPEDAARLARLVHGIPAKVNLIAWNPHAHSSFRRPSDERVRRFQAELKARGLPVYVRRSRGLDIDAACGQLAARDAEAPVALRR